MSITKKASELQAILERNGLLKKAGSEKIEHIASPLNQGSLGKEQQKIILDGCLGNYASNPAASKITNVPGDYVDGQDLCGESAMKSTGTSIKTINTAGLAQGTPATVAKTAALRQKLTACVLNLMRKAAAYQEAMDNQFVSATLVMCKVAALTNLSDLAKIDELTRDIEQDFRKLAKANPLFGPACEYVAMRKMASEIEALAAAEGIPLEQAAAALDEAMANDPAAQEEFNNEVEGEALSELAGAEQEAEAMMAGLSDTAAKVSELTGQLITPDDIIAAVLDVAAQALELGVPPEVLIQQAAEDLMAQNPEFAGESGVLVTPLDLAMALKLIDAAAAEGISPLELIQGLAGGLEGSAAPVDAPVDTPTDTPVDTPAEPATEKTDLTAATEPALGAPADSNKLTTDSEEVKKTACLHKLASTRRWANLIKILAKG